MNWEQRFCPNPCCTDRTWMIRRDPATRDVWWVATRVDDHPYTVAATNPVCPRCGTALLRTVELEDGLDRQIDAEVGPVFDFVRSLA